jgi:hypothetical protein
MSDKLRAKIEDAVDRLREQRIKDVYDYVEGRMTPREFLDRAYQAPEKEREAIENIMKMDD